MNVHILKEKDEIRSQCVDFILKEIEKNPELSLALSVNSNYKDLYITLVQEAKKRKLSFGKVKFFIMSEYVDSNKLLKYSHYSFLKENFFAHIDVKKSLIFTFDSLGKDKKQVLTDYESLIEEEGGIDFAIVSVNKRSNLLFNDYGGSLSSLSNEFFLQKEHMKQLQRLFPNLKAYPKSVFTMGVGTILAAKKIVVYLVGFNESKNASTIIEGAVQAMKNATALQFHNNTHFFLDEQASVNLEFKSSYYWNDKIRYIPVTPPSVKKSKKEEKKTIDSNKEKNNSRKKKNSTK